MSGLNYRRDIDGLRTVAVIPVILFHAGIASMAGGFVGVDVFFVISGFLITSIIARELDTGDFSILRFYERRARRILPALFFVLIVTTIAAYYFMLPYELADYGRWLSGVIFFVSNIVFWHESGYFRGAFELNPLLHTWSLAVEKTVLYLLSPVFIVNLALANAGGMVNPRCDCTWITGAIRFSGDPNGGCKFLSASHTRLGIVMRLFVGALPNAQTATNRDARRSIKSGRIASDSRHTLFL